jgi:hypothetical protein
MATGARGGGGGGGDSHILREYLVALGFRIDEQRRRNFTNILTDLDKRARMVGVSLLGIATTAGVMAHTFAKSMERVGFSARYANTTVKELQALEFAGRRAGLQGGALEGMVKGLATAIKENPGFQTLLESLGVGVSGRKTDSVLVDLLTRLNEINKTDPALAIAYGKQFGIASESLGYVLADFPKFLQDMEEYRRIQEKTGVDAEQLTKMAHEYMDQWEKLKMRLGAFAGVLMEKALPGMDAMLTKTNEIIERWTVLAQQAHDFSDFVSKLFGGKTDANGNTDYGISVPDPMQWWRDWRAARDARRSGKFLSGDAAAIAGDDLSVPGRPMQEGGTFLSGDRAAIEGDDLSVAGTPMPSDRQAYLRALEERYGLPRGTLDTIWKIETGRGTKRGIRSSKGAAGPFQIMPDLQKDLGVKDPDDFTESAQAIAPYIRRLMDTYKGNLQMVGAAYNWGPGNLQKYGLGKAPKETREWNEEFIKGIGAAGGLNVNTEINIHGVTDPVKAGDTAASKQGEVANRVIRNMSPRVQ